MCMSYQNYLEPGAQARRAKAESLSKQEPPCGMEIPKMHQRMDASLGGCIMISIIDL